MHKLLPLTYGVAIFIVGGALAPAAARAGETARFLNAPAAIAQHSPKLAVQFELKLHLAEGRGLAKSLMDAGVGDEDAAAAARLAAGHLGDGAGGCFAKVSIARDSAAGPFSLVRITLMTAADQTVIERRESGLSIASQAPNRRFPRLV